MSILPPSNKGLKHKGPTGWQAANADAERRRAEQEARDADPVERALRFIRSRGRVIFRASVQGGPADRWKYAGRLIDANGVLALAEGLRVGTSASAAARSAPAPAAETASPITIAIRKSNSALQPTPAVRATSPAPAVEAQRAAQQQEAAMGHHFKTESQEDINCRERGTTPARVRQDLQKLKDLLGAGGAAQRLGVGKSSVGNIIAGHAVVGPTILLALYGDQGCTLRPSLAALMADRAGKVGAPVGAVEQPATTPPASEPAVAIEAKSDPEPQLDQGAGIFAGGPLVMGETRTATFRYTDLLPDLVTLNVGDLLANAERRRDALRAELAGIDDQIKAVLSLAAGAA